MREGLRRYAFRCPDRVEIALETCLGTDRTGKSTGAHTMKAAGSHAFALQKAKGAAIRIG